MLIGHAWYRCSIYNAFHTQAVLSAFADAYGLSMRLSYALYISIKFLLDVTCAHGVLLELCAMKLVFCIIMVFTIGLEAARVLVMIRDNVNYAISRFQCSAWRYKIETNGAII